MTKVSNQTLTPGQHKAKSHHSSTTKNGHDYHSDEKGVDESKSSKEKRGEKPDIKLPSSPKELNKYEQQIFDILKDWRAMKAKTEAGGLTHHIAQNRTICEVIGRKRNDNSFALGNDAKIAEDLKKCWGFGTKKTLHGHEGYDMITYMNENEDIQSLLRQSRKQHGKRGDDSEKDDGDESE